MKNGLAMSGSKHQPESIVYIQAIHALLFQFTQSGEKQAFLDGVVRLLQRESQCECVGIRVLDEDGCIPYRSYTGFSHDFWESENHLQVSAEDCSCTRLVQGTLRPSDYRIMSSSGSICCNDLQNIRADFSPEEIALY